jgi:TPR repeat protein
MQRLAEGGDVRAQHWMGLMLQNRGRYDEAIHWYARAADRGDGRSANSIAFFYEHGVGRPKNLKEAMAWHQRGAALGDFGSQIRYASALRTGTVFKRDERQAFRWYSKAAAPSNDYAQRGYAYLPLAEMYEQGIGAPRDLRRAYAFAKAAELAVDDSDTQNHVKARSLQARVAARLQSADLEAAERLFETLRPDLAQWAARDSARWAGISWFILIMAAAVIFWRARRLLLRTSR